MFNLIWLIASFLVVVILRFLFTSLLIAASSLLTGSTKLGKVVYSIFFFPGILLHELSHFFSAAMLGVPTGDIEIFPRETHEGVKLGSVKVAKKDFMRNAIIGSAPLLIGSLVLFILLKIKFPYVFTSPSLKTFTKVFSTTNDWLDALYFYIIFTVSNTMVLSKNDREGLLPSVLFALAILIVSYTVSGPTLTYETIHITASNIFSSLTITFTLVALINFILILPLLLIVRILEKHRQKKVKFKLGI